MDDNYHCHENYDDAMAVIGVATRRGRTPWLVGSGRVPVTTQSAPVGFLGPFASGDLAQQLFAPPKRELASAKKGGQAESPKDAEHERFAGHEHSDARKHERRYAEHAPWRCAAGMQSMQGMAQNQQNGNSQQMQNGQGMQNCQAQTIFAAPMQPMQNVAGTQRFRAGPTVQFIQVPAAMSAMSLPAGMQLMSLGATQRKVLKKVVAWMLDG
eukprot:Skav211089  [mRNA]  locus=scaffold2002:192573:201724:+ [translate_table: standard]